MKEAMFYKRLPEKKVQCFLCPRRCVILPGKRGFCRVRENQGGRLMSLVYGQLCSMAIDPIEKKPLFHFAPGSRCLSVCTVGCNLDCQFCQNSDISHPNLSSQPASPTANTHSSQNDILGEDVPPEEIVSHAVRSGVGGIAYTYTEPTIFFEYALDTMKLAKKRNLYNVWVSNGYTNPEPAMQASKYLHAINVDIKGPERFYRKLCNIPNEKAIKDALLVYREQKVWIEITNLMIPGWNTGRKDTETLCRWVVKNLGEDTPVHFSRFHPSFRMMDAKPTPVRTLEEAERIARGIGLRWVYIGNVWGHGGESTTCPSCGKKLISRDGLSIRRTILKCGCGEKVPIAGRKWARL